MYVGPYYVEYYSIINVSLASYTVYLQVHVANVTEEVANIIDRGYFVIELWGHHGAGFLDQGSDDESKPG